MGRFGKIWGIFGILFLVFMGVMFFHTREIEQELEIVSTMNEELQGFDEAIKLHDYDTAYNISEAYSESCFEYIKETRDTDCLKDTHYMINQIKKQQEPPYEEKLRQLASEYVKKTSPTSMTKQYICNRNAYNCDSFPSQRRAQEVFDKCGGVKNDVHHLDRDVDGIPCETLP